jgi:hypothetical protein
MGKERIKILLRGKWLGSDDGGFDIEPSSFQGSTVVLKQSANKNNEISAQASSTSPSKNLQTSHISLPRQLSIQIKFQFNHNCSIHSRSPLPSKMKRKENGKKFK